MFGGLLIAHGLLKKGHPYRVGKIGLVLGALVLAYAVSSYYGFSEYLIALLAISAGVILLAAQFSRGKS